MSQLVVCLFVASGCAALIYEVVWLHLLRLTIGVSTYSLGVLLAAFMGGMAVGSWAYARLVSPLRNPLRAYAVLEWAIGVCGLTMPFVLRTASDLYDSTFGWHGGSVFVRALLTGLLLLPPTALMGATLPAVSRYVRADVRGATWLGWCYGANLFGAVVGSLLAGLVLMRHFDALVASLVAVGINLFAGAIAWRLALKSRYDAPGDLPILPSSSNTSPLVPCAVAAIAVFFSGAAALGAEVVWTRLLTLTLGPTVYAFAIVLAIFLTGLGIGSFVATSMIPRLRHPLLGLCACQLALAITIAITSKGFSDASLDWSSLWVVPSLVAYPNTLRDIVRCTITVFPSALFWGASLPLAMAATVGSRNDLARTVGSLLAANTVGAIVGALGMTFALIPALGAQGGQQALVATSAISAVWCALWLVREARSTEATASLRPVVWLVLAIASGIFGFWAVEPPAAAIFAYGRDAIQRKNDAPIVELVEGVHSPMVITYWPHYKVTALHLDGKLEASDEKIDLRVERMLAHVPQLMSERPRSVLVVGLGAGITAGAFSMDERTEKITICELEPRLPQLTSRHFGKANRHVLENPRTRLVIDDGRHFLRTTDEKFDVIAVDPIHPWVRGAAALYSEEFFAECRRHLNPGGLVSFWVPLHSMTVDSVRSELATFFKVFSFGTVWHTGGTNNQRHMMVVGSNNPQAIDLPRADRLASADSEVAKSLGEMDFELDDILALYVGDRRDLAEWLTGAEINRDWSLRLEYLAGTAAYSNERERIFGEAIAHRAWPSVVLQGDETRIRAIGERMRRWDALEETAPAATGPNLNPSAR